MTSSLRKWYDTYIEAGLPREQAMRKAFADSTLEDDQQQANNGVTYDDELVRIAAVHTRQDVALLNLELQLIGKSLKGIKVRLTAVVLLLSAIALVLLIP